MSTELSIYQRMSDPLESVRVLGTAIAQSAMFGCQNPSQGQVLAMSCLCENKSPVEIARKYDIIEGNLSMKSAAMLAEFRERGGKHHVNCRTADQAEIELRLDGETEIFSLTWEEAKAEPFTKGKKGIKKNWATPVTRKQMLWARVVSDGVRTMCPEVVAGTYTPEEIMDFEKPRARKAKAAVAAGEVIATTPPVSQGVQLSAPIEPTSSRDADRCRQDQMAEIWRLWNGELGRDEVAAAAMFQAAGKEGVTDLTVKEADDLIAHLGSLITEAQGGKLFTPETPATGTT